jgi:SAM-dependent methyltransferase
MERISSMARSEDPSIAPPSEAALREIFRLKYGDPAPGWGPQMRLRAGYFNPDDHYEALVAGLVRPQTVWLDVGCGRDIFPSNRALARLLADRCRRLVGLDPDATIEENPFIHERARMPLEVYEKTGEPFDLVTARMVAEHVDDPVRFAASLGRCLRPGGLAVIYTVDGKSPVPILTRLVPFALHHSLKRVIWNVERKDTFPTRFRMNSRTRLQAIMAGAGFEERIFLRVDDCRTFSAFRPLLRLDLALRSGLHWVGLGHPEACLLGVYRRRGDAGA